MIKPQQVNKGFFSTNFTAIKLNSKTMTDRRYLEYYLTFNSKGKKHDTDN
jgi:hypothetical protein